MAEPLSKKLYEIFRNVPPEKFPGDKNVLATSKAPLYLGRGEIDKGFIKFRPGTDTPGILKHEEFHQAQYLADLINKLQKDPTYVGEGQAGNEWPFILGEDRKKAWYGFTDRHGLDAMEINNYRQPEYPAYAFSADPIEVRRGATPLQRKLLPQQRQAAFNEWYDKVRMNSPTVGNIISQATAPSLVRRNLQSYPQPVPMTTPPEVRQLNDNPFSFIDLLKQVLNERRK